MTPAEIITIATLVLILGAGAWLVYKHYVQNLPLTIAGQLAYNRKGSTDVYYIRITLGNGRLMRCPNVSAVYTTVHGTQTTLTVHAPTTGWVIGPITLIIRDTEQVLRMQGALHLSASTQSASKDWSAERLLPHTQFIAGRYMPVATPYRRGIKLQHRSWQVVDEATT